jgi:hypothetical protein
MPSGNFPDSGFCRLISGFFGSPAEAFEPGRRGVVLDKY